MDSGSGCSRVSAALTAGLLALFTGLFLLSVLQESYRPLKRSYIPRGTRQSWAVKIDPFPGDLPEGPAGLPVGSHVIAPDYTGFARVSVWLTDAIGLAGVYWLLMFFIGINSVLAWYWVGRIRNRKAE